MRPQAKWFECFSAFGNPMKHDARVFEITSPTKEIIVSMSFFFSSQIDTLRSTFTADRKPLQVTWPDFNLAFTENSPRFRRQEVGFRVSHLPQLLFAWMFCDPTYAWHWYTEKNLFLSFYMNFNINKTTVLFLQGLNDNCCTTLKSNMAAWKHMLKLR